MTENTDNDMLLAPGEAYLRLGVVIQEWKTIRLSRPNSAADAVGHVEEAIAICGKVSARHGATSGQLQTLERCAAKVREALS